MKYAIIVREQNGNENELCRVGSNPEAVAKGARQKVFRIKTFRTIGGRRTARPVLYLEDQKPMVLNRTNFEILADAYGDSDEWAGHKVKIYAARTQYQGRSIDGLRVEAVGPTNVLMAG
jgi:hypothetical protein